MKFPKKELMVHTNTLGDHFSKWLRPLPLAISNVSSSTLGAWSSGSKRLPEVKGHLLPKLPYSKDFIKCLVS
jgi:hypothetical protein